MGFLGIILALVLVGVPFAKILDRAGFSKIWTLLVIIPVLNVLALWVLAYSRWPSDENDGMIDITPPQN